VTRTTTPAGSSRKADLVVIGAGAKAAALAAKVHVLNCLGAGPLSLTIIEQTAPAASWLGRNGMTSGDEPLAVPPVKDVGFPYLSSREFYELGAPVDREMLAFSWQQHLIALGEYAAWVNAGAPAISHRRYGEYLGWVLERATSGVDLRAGRASRVSLTTDGAGWSVQTAGPDGARNHRGAAVVITGPGTHRALPHDPAVADRVFHCDSSRADLLRIPEDGCPTVAILGGGESALSCVSYLRGTRPRAHLTVFTPNLPLSRGESFLENRVFADPDAVGWSSMSLESRRDFIKHCDRGVFDTGSLAALARDVRTTFVTGRILSVTGTAAGTSIRYAAPGAATALDSRYDYVVNCTGFELMPTLQRLLGSDLWADVEHRMQPHRCGLSEQEMPLGRALEIAGVSPRLHVPGLAGLSQGPGFANLGCLGLLANRILGPLLTATGREASGTRLIASRSKR